MGDDDAVDSDINETTGQSDTVTITDSKSLPDLDRPDTEFPTSLV